MKGVSPMECGLNFEEGRIIGLIMEKGKIIMKKIICCFLTAALLICSIVFSTFASAEDGDNSNYAMSGLKHMDRDVIDMHKNSVTDSNSRSYSSSVELPNSVNLSESNCFPLIGDQGNVNSCAAFAAVYYQYTYEVNMLKGTSARIESNQYSPNWPFYAMLPDDDPTVGLKYDDIYSFLKDHGALKWNQDVYDKTAFNPSMPWPTNEAYVKEAMMTRLSNWEAIEISNIGTVITSNDDPDLNEVKEKLSEGKILTVGVYWGDAYTNETDQNRDKTIFYRFGSDTQGVGHALTIVGYDDNVTYDINGNGYIESGERGAFKVANSWGDDWGDNGFFWIMYDALNGVSSVNGDWDDLSTRTGAFENHDNDYLGNGNDYNLFTCITVEEKSPFLMAEINLNSHNRYFFNISLVNRFDNEIFDNVHVTSYGGQNYTVPQARTLFFDYDEIISSLNKIEDETYWGTKTTYFFGNHEDFISSIKLTDNVGNVIETMAYEYIDSYTVYYSCITDFEYGDLNYDGVLTTDDVSLIMQTITNHPTISNLQRYFADYNGDGVVNMKDASAVSKAIQ